MSRSLRGASTSFETTGKYVRNVNAYSLAQMGQHIYRVFDHFCAFIGSWAVQISILQYRSFGYHIFTAQLGLHH